MVERATPIFSALVRHRAGEMVHAKIHHLPSPSGVALSTVIPCGKAVESKRKSGAGAGPAD